MSRGVGIASLYQVGGREMLAYRLGALFTKIETEAEKVRHNDILAEVLDLVNKDFPGGDGRLLKPEHEILNFIADYLLKRKAKRKRKFLSRLAERILLMSKLKG